MFSFQSILEKFQCVLASMVMVTMKAYVKKFTELRKLWPMFKIDFLIWIASMLLTICYDMAEGLALAIAFAILTTIFRNQPRWHILSKNDEGQYRETKKKQMEYIEGSTCVFRMDGPLIFTSVDRFALVSYSTLYPLKYSTYTKLYFVVFYI
uniref:Sulfate_transp domain-containing protein n=1 Tax=Ascaris lumbricoides TaxID=6252 RepID=A0A0M3IW99_ASCLU